jgi:hypothetical protein
LTCYAFFFSFFIWPRSHLFSICPFLFLSFLSLSISLSTSLCFYVNVLSSHCSFCFLSSVIVIFLYFCFYLSNFFVYFYVDIFTSSFSFCFFGSVIFPFPRPISQFISDLEMKRKNNKQTKLIKVKRISNIQPQTPLWRPTNRTNDSLAPNKTGSQWIKCRASKEFYSRSQTYIRLLNLQLQRQRCSRLEHFSKYIWRRKHLCFQNSWHWKLLQHCDSRS